MPNIAPGLKNSRLLATFAESVFGLALASTATLGQKPSGGRIVGNIDGIAVDAGGPHIKGWACQQGRPESLTVHIYANEGANDAPKGIFALAGKADLDEEPAVDAACKDTVGRKHRFDIPLPGAILVKLHGMPLFVHGIRVVGSVENAAIAGSGTMKFPDAPPVRHAPASYPRLTGRTRALTRIRACSIRVRNCRTSRGALIRRPRLPPGSFYTCWPRTARSHPQN